jgi:hypothetical protein
VSEQFFDPRAQQARARPIPAWRWTVWFICLAAGMVLFYVVLTPVWIGFRAAAWTAEFRARRRRA